MPLERSVVLRGLPGVEPGKRHMSMLELGMALWESKRDRKRGLALVQEARDGLVAAGPHWADHAEEAEAWLAAHAGARGR